MMSIVMTSGAPASAGILADPAVIAAVCAAVFALVGGLAAAWIAKRSKDQELFLNALNFLTGGTQKRSVGIAIITDFAERRDMRSVATLIFNAQRKHLEDKNYHAEVLESSIEKFNYDQMGKIIRYWESHEASRGKRRPWRKRDSALKIDFAPPPSLDGAGSSKTSAPARPAEALPDC